VKLTVKDSQGQEGSATIQVMAGVGGSGGKPPAGFVEFIFVPVNWNTKHDFESVANAHFDAFVKGAEIGGCPNSYMLSIMDPNTDNCSIPGISCNKSVAFYMGQIKACAKKAGYNTNPKSARIAGITTGGLGGAGGCTGGGPNYATISLHDPSNPSKSNIISAHELGHTFYFCEQYRLYGSTKWAACWWNQNQGWKNVGGCKNYYPANVPGVGYPKCAYNVSDYTFPSGKKANMVTNCPTAVNALCRGRKIPYGNQTARSLMSYAFKGSQRMFDCFETETIQDYLGCK